MCAPSRSLDSGLPSMSSRFHPLCFHSWSVAPTGYVSSAAEFRRKFETMCNSMGIEGVSLRSEVLALADGLNDAFDEVAAAAQVSRPILALLCLFFVFLYVAVAESVVARVPLLAPLFFFFFFSRSCGAAVGEGMVSAQGKGLAPLTEFLFEYFFVVLPCRCTPHPAGPDGAGGGRLLPRVLGVWPWQGRAGRRACAAAAAPRCDCPRQ